MPSLPIEKALRTIMLLALVTGCAALPQPEVIAPTQTVPPGYRAPEGPGDLYRIDRAALTLHTYRAGWLAGLAHSHVMETDAVSGTIRLADPRSASAARLYFRPWDLALDDAAARAVAGPGFESERTAADIAATRTRMLGPRGFDSNRHPFVTVDVQWAGEQLVRLDIRFRDRLVEHLAPVTWSLMDGRLEARADFELSHAMLGIRPYSAFAGAIAVAQPIRVQLVLSASRVSGV